jgi:hypothetical protein
MTDNLKILQPKIDKDHQDSYWYEGQVAVIETDKWIYSLEACGETDFTYHRLTDKISDTGHELYEYLRIKNDTSDAYGLNLTDKDLWGDNITWDMNNWFEVIGINKQTSTAETVMGDTASNYDEGIALLELYVKEKMYEKDDKKTVPIDLEENTCEKCGGEASDKLIGDETYNKCGSCGWITH